MAGVLLKVRIADIAVAAEVSRQAVYLHFGNRANLLLAAVHLSGQLEPDRLHQASCWRCQMRVTHGWVIVSVGALDPLLRIPEVGHLRRVERPEGGARRDEAVARKR
jgi:Bacterial regulatory proteins, tetR family